MEKSQKHPCFNPHAKEKYARVHLPVAPECNIQCNYCNRKFDCVNESRPGVTSAVLKPPKAVEYLEKLHERMEHISVVGIAGPGDPFANPEKVLETLRLVKQRFPELIFCLSTNGLNLFDHIDAIAALDVTHVTLTINAIDPAIAAKVYRFARHKKRVYQGLAAAELLIENQLQCIPELKKHGIVVKVNTIIIPGVNEHHVDVVAQKVKELGADIMNCMPLYPTKDTPFETIKHPSPGMMKAIRATTATIIDQMAHCSRCRADAAGLLGKDDIDSRHLLQKMTKEAPLHNIDKKKVAVGTHEGMLVNRHLGDTSEFYIFEHTRNGYKLTEQRTAPAPGGGDARWDKLADVLNDCRAVLVSGAGNKPSSVLQRKGIRVMQMTGLIDEGLDHIFENKPLKAVAKQDSFKCGSGCSGNAQGCA